MSEVLRAVGIFCSYAVLAVFAQSAVFTRGLGVSRLVQLVGCLLYTSDAADEL